MHVQATHRLQGHLARVTSLRAQLVTVEMPGEGLGLGLRGLTGCSMTRSTVRLMSAMASVYTAASSWISLWFCGRRAR